jgi:uncharacterized protein YbjT (DUF2867 family)
MTALLIGATGATGKDLLELLLKDTDFKRVDVFVRRNLGIEHEKLNTHIIDFDNPEQWKHLVKGDVLFSCLGTTLKAAGSKEGQKKVDYDYQLQFAKAAKQNNLTCYVLVSSGFASSLSPLFYAKMKGQLEDEVKILNFPKVIIFNPPTLERKHSDRKLEVIATKTFHFFNYLGLFKSIRPLPTHLLAKAMLNAVNLLGNGEFSIKGQEIRKYVNDPVN